MAKGKKVSKKRVVKVESEGLAFIHASFNNIIISLCNRAGQVISWGSAGKSGFRGSKKNTPYAAQMAAKCVAQKAISLGVESIGVSIKGTGEGREITIRAFKLAGLKIIYVEDRTPIAHNGCRPPKKRKL